MIAALFVQSDGVYSGNPLVDPWDEIRDARLYGGPWPVIAHPPCARWGRYWRGSPVSHIRFQLGDDDGCFASALRNVRQYGGVLEHPKDSHAWKWFGLQSPRRSGGWVKADKYGWTCCVDQGHYGHKASKATWLYAVRCRLPKFIWGPAGKRLDLTGCTSEQRRRLIKTGVCQRLSRNQRERTPFLFRNKLLWMAKTVGNLQAKS